MLNGEVQGRFSDEGQAERYRDTLNSLTDKNKAVVVDERAECMPKVARVASRLLSVVYGTDNDDDFILEAEAILKSEYHNE